MAGVAKIDMTENKPSPRNLNFSYTFDCGGYDSEAWERATKQAINSGIQEAIGVTADGIFGGKSIAALAKAINTDTINAAATHKDTLQAEFGRAEQQCSNRAASNATPPRAIYESQQAPSLPYYQPPQVGPQITPEQSRLMDSVRGTGRGAVVTGPIRGPISIRSQRDGTTIIQNGDAAILVDQYGNKTPIDTPSTQTTPSYRRFPRH